MPTQRDRPGVAPGAAATIAGSGSTTSTLVEESPSAEQPQRVAASSVFIAYVTGVPSEDAALPAWANWSAEGPGVDSIWNGKDLAVGPLSAAPMTEVSAVHHLLADPTIRGRLNGAFAETWAAGEPPVVRAADVVTAEAIAAEVAAAVAEEVAAEVGGPRPPRDGWSLADAEEVFRAVAITTDRGDLLPNGVVVWNGAIGVGIGLIHPVPHRQGPMAWTAVSMYAEEFIDDDDKAAIMREWLDKYDGMATLADLQARRPAEPAAEVAEPAVEAPAIEGSGAELVIWPQEWELGAYAPVVRGEVQFQARQDWLRREARRLLDARERPPAELPEVLTLEERLQRPREPLIYRIASWQPAGTRILVAAQYKAGKTTLMGNLIASLVDGVPFLGSALIAPLPGRVLLLDFEMSPNQLDAWYEDLGIVNQDRVIILPMRGKGAAFDIRDPRCRAEWAELVRSRGVAYVILDCLRPVMDSLGLDENHEAGVFLVAFDQLLTEAGIEEGCIVQHMGHAGERARGDSRLRDWPDVTWTLVREGEDPTSPRYISAFGRDVEQHEQRLEFDRASRRLTIAGGGRREAETEDAVSTVAAAVADEPGLTGRGYERKLQMFATQKMIRAGLRQGVQRGLLRVEQPNKRDTFYHPAIPTASTASDCVNAVPATASLRIYNAVQSQTADADGDATQSACIKCGGPAPYRNPNTWLCATCEEAEGGS